MNRRLAVLTALAFTAASVVTLLGISEASAQRGLYKGWLAPAKYRTTEERRYTIGGGLPTHSVSSARRKKAN